MYGTRVRLERVDTDNIRTLEQWYADPAYWGPFYDPWPFSLASLKAFADSTDSERRMLFYIVEIASGERVGSIGYMEPYVLRDYYRGLELWAEMSPAHRGKAYAKDAVRLLVTSLFQRHPISRVQASVVDGNDAAEQALMRSGFVSEGRMRAAHFLHGQYVDLLVYAVTRSDWISDAVYRERQGEF